MQLQVKKGCLEELSLKNWGLLALLEILSVAFRSCRFAGRGYSVQRL